MPADSHTLEDEGVVISPQPLTDVDAIVAGMRQPAQRKADLRAQVAANRTGAARLGELHARMPLAEAMQATIEYAERRTRAALKALEDGTRHAEDVLEAADGDLHLQLEATIRGDELTLDFTGSAPQHDGNLNCPLAVTRSACYFVVRCLTDPDAPASGGAFAPVSVRAPEGCLVNAQPPAAVAAGNVETSSRIADVVFLALGEAVDVPAQGQGTMNNVTLGSDSFTYYETIGGGQGACPGANGPSAVHVAMSNTFSTPTEALELGYPIRVERHALRLGSGGAGGHHGGDGVVRELRVLEPARLSIVSERRRHAPQGRKGGAPGAPGRNLLNGDELPAKVTRDLRPGDVVRIETPGGGGYGSPGLPAS